MPMSGIRYVPGFNYLFNYLDYADAFRKRKDYRDILNRAFQYLASEQVTPWIDLQKLKTEHMSYKANHENAFLVLIGLALNLEKENEK